MKSFDSGKIVVLIVYVDDIVLSRDDTAEIIRLKRKMGYEFEKDLWNLNWRLHDEGKEFRFHKGNIHLTC